MLRVVFAPLVLGFTIYTFLDCVRTREEAVTGLPKIVWVFVILLFPLAGGAGWYLAGRPPRPARQSRRGPLGPDDDPDFLKGL